ncbi:MAG: hypothetical protein AAGI07_00635 [Bacteroidota bacterium]
MARSEQLFIDLCKKQIEQKFSFGNGNGYTQRNLEILSKYIEEKSGITISLSTLKRLWKNDFKQSPQLATLNALASVLDYKDWQAFKQANQKKTIPFSPTLKWISPIAVFMAVILLAIYFSFNLKKDVVEENNTSITVKGSIHFEISKTITSGIPNTVVFNYDVSNVVADSFFIQQSWNDDYRFAVNPNSNTLTSIYYESGYHRAKLIANDSILIERPIHILSDGWEPHIYNNSIDRPITFKNENFIKNGQLHLDTGMLARRNIDLTKRFYSRITNSQVFNVHSDDFSLTTQLKVDSLANELCPWICVIIVTDVHIFRVILQNKGCEKYAAYKLGEIEKGGNDNDLSALGCYVYNWQELEVLVKNKHAGIYLNGMLTYEEDYKEDLGKIVGLIYIFDRTGSIKYTKLEDGNGNIVFEDDFMREIF